MAEMFRDASIEPDWHRIGEKLGHSFKPTVAVHALDQSASESGEYTGDNCVCDSICMCIMMSRSSTVVKHEWIDMYFNSIHFLGDDIIRIT